MQLSLPHTGCGFRSLLTQRVGFQQHTAVSTLDGLARAIAQPPARGSGAQSVLLEVAMGTGGEGTWAVEVPVLLFTLAPKGIEESARIAVEETYALVVAVGDCDLP